MNLESRHLYAIMNSILGDPDNESLYSVLADWLEEQDEPELALVHRRFCSDEERKIRQAKKRLQIIADCYADGNYSKMIEQISSKGSFVFSDSEFRYKLDWQQLFDDIKIVTKKELAPIFRDLGNYQCSC